jgi:zinc protease
MSFKPERSTPPLYSPVGKINYLKPHHFSLDNGMPVYLLDGSSHEVIKLEFVFKSGSYHQSKPLTALTIANLLKGGTKKKSSEEINYIWDFYGASLQIDAQKDIITVTVFCLSKYVENIVDILFEMIAESTFPQEEISVFLNNMLQKYIVNKKKVQHVSMLYFAGLVFGHDHPYGRQAVEDDFSNLNRDDLLEYFDRFIHPGNAICIISGKYPDDIATILETAFKKFPMASGVNNKTKVVDFDVPPAAKHSITFDGALQSAIRVGKNMINRDHRSYHKVAITNTLLGGYFGSRLMQNIRQDKGYTYGIGSSVVNLLHSAYFFISSQVGKDVCQNALDEVYNELKDLRLKPADEYELTMLRNYLSASMLRSFDGPFQQSERFKEMLLFGLDYDHFDEYIQTIVNITARDIQDTAEEFFHEKDMIELVVG